ncbi:dicarboxylate/amino acid:cation symporter [Brachyspira hampsonii]|uniref:Dicarboxylate/amino acid:cation symporter n=2 Tax=Brachyspira hampsonii TaxID=1287055 RepID=A0AAC9TUW5_9SPIR|nr:dicarboxylate/amino acid:cation symporter [Brachyspira hampsonii]ASJ21249.1 dicarboxylate/amino acid:cation symporter [Brachyspira hampsonii]ELV05698.1 Na+/H+-dicarboxylate symporter GltP [Brachyspira hampsonii 30599]OEJ17597.1 amino acid transporter [Brachyspira hampsonii]
MLKDIRSKLLIIILISLIIGAILGIIVSSSASEATIVKLISIADPIGNLFVRLLKMIVMPVIIFTLISGVASISPKHLGVVGIAILAFYMITSVFASILGLAVGNIFNPGVGLKLDDAMAVTKELVKPNLVDTLLAIVPTNPFASFAKGDGDVLPTILFSIFFGISLAFCRDNEKTRESAEIVYKFFEGCTQIIIKIVGWIMFYAPIGVLALIFSVFVKNGSQAFGQLLKVTSTVYIGLILQLLVVYTVINIIFGLKPIKFLKYISEACFTAFVTRSSNGTLPISMKIADEKMGIQKGVYSFTLPLGATINMDGTTIYLGICAIFIANATGHFLNFSSELTIIAVSVLASIGTAGVPGAGSIMLLMVLNSIGLSVDSNPNIAAAYGMILGIDALLDMGRTALNISGDLCGTAVVAKITKQMDMSKWN